MSLRPFAAFLVAALLVAVLLVAPASLHAQEEGADAGADDATEQVEDLEEEPQEELEGGLEGGLEGKAEEEPEESPADADAEAEELFRDFERFDSREMSTPGQRSTGRSLELLDREGLRGEGFEFGTESDSADSSTALMLALSAGLVFRGIGHFYLGDTRTGFFLLGLEGVSALLVGSAAGYYALTDGQTAAASFFAPALQLGVATFVFSYLLDVVGTMQTEQRLARNTRGSRGIGFRARYGLFNALGFPLRHVIDAALLADIGGFYARAATTQDVFLEAASYRGRAGVRPIRGASELTYLSLERGGEFFEYQGEGEFGRISADGRIGGSYSLGQLYPHLDQFALQGDIGFGYRWYQFAPTGTSTFELAVSRPYVPFAISATMNVSERLNVSGGYGSSDGSWVPPLHRMLGVAHVEFVYRSSSYGDISLRTEIGDGFGLWLGGSFWLLR